MHSGRHTTFFFAALVPLLWGNFGAAARAQAPPAVPNTTPQFLITRYDTVEFSKPSPLELQTWQIQSKGVGDVEVRVWYIAGGKAMLREQKVLSWNGKEQSGTWRLMLMEQKPKNETQVPAIGLQTVFDTKNDRPTMTMSGISTNARQKTPPLPSAFFMHFVRTSAEAPGISPDQTVLLYAAQTEKGLGLKSSSSPFTLARDKEPKPVEALTKISRTPGTAFQVVTLLWKRAHDKQAKP